MRKKVNPVALLYLVLLVAGGFLGFFNSILVVNAPPTPTVGVAEYNYYVVAGYQTTPTLPPPAHQPAGFTFTCIASNNATSTGYNFGNLSDQGGRTYLYDGCAEAAPCANPNAYVTVNITNVLGYDITLLDLTAEVTAGTPTTPWRFGASPDWGMGNMTLVAVDTLDPWDPAAATSYDEVSYPTGAVEVHRDPSRIVREGPLSIVRGFPDWFRQATGDQGWPYPATQLGPGSLLENDLNGDAAATGHVKPVVLTNGSILTDYFGLTLFGAVDLGTQINATITLRLAYTPPPDGAPAVCDVRVVNLVYYFPAFPYDTIEVFPNWWNPINITLRNWGTVPINVTVNAYYGKDGSWFQIGSPQISSLDPANRTALTFYWDLRASGLGKAVYPVKVNATATCETLTDTDEFLVNVKVRVMADSDGDNDVDASDRRKQELVLFTSPPQQAYLNSNSFPLFTDFDGDRDVDVGDERYLDLNLFKTWPGPLWGDGISIYSPAGSIAVDPPTVTLQASRTITVSVIITDITDCVGYQLWIDYDSTILQLISWTFDTDPAHPLSPTQMAPVPSSRIDSDLAVLGIVRIATVWKSATPPYTNAGNSTAAKLTFQALTTGSARFVFDPVWTRATDDPGNDIRFKNLELRMQSDVDGDHDVDVGDQRKVQLAMFTAYPDPVYVQYNTAPIFTDVDRDGDVDVGDQRIQQLNMFESW